MAQGVWVKVFPPPPVVKPELPGIGGWADISDTPTSTYTDGKGVKWNVWTFTADGTINVTTAGLLDMLLVGAGGSIIANSGSGCGGQTALGPHSVPTGAQAVVVGQPNARSVVGSAESIAAASSIGGNSTGRSGYGVNGAGSGATAWGGSGLTSMITGTALVVSSSGAARNYASEAPVYGGGAFDNGTNTLDPQPGVVIVRRPA